MGHTVSLLMTKGGNRLNAVYKEGRAGGTSQPRRMYYNLTCVMQLYTDYPKYEFL